MPRASEDRVRICVAAIHNTIEFLTPPSQGHLNKTEGVAGYFAQEMDVTELHAALVATKQCVLADTGKANAGQQTLILIMCVFKGNRECMNRVHTVIPIMYMKWSLLSNV